jgi:hypothetical protein
MNHVTQILERVEQGDGKAAEELLPLANEELPKLAAAKMAREAQGRPVTAGWWGWGGICADVRV